MSEIRKIYNYFKSIYPELKTNCPDMFVVISKALDTHIFQKYSEAYLFAIRQYGLGNFMLQPI